MSTFYGGNPGGITLQAVLSQSSCYSNLESVKPHHPITCSSGLRYSDHLECDHVAVAVDDRRTKFCIDHSIAVLLIELASKL